MTVRFLRASAITLTVLVALGACSAGDSEEPSGPTVLQAGEVGEKSTEVSADDLPEAETEFNEVDREFVEMMVPHHQQAVEMGALAEKYAKDPRVKEFAQRIGDTQSAEIDSMQSWLTTRGLPEADVSMDGHGDHAMHMPGMLSDADLDRLAAARGSAFDTLYVRKMIGHHEGAIQMADRALSEGTDPINRGFAADVAATQQVEAGRLEGILDSL